MDQNKQRLLITLGISLAVIFIFGISAAIIGIYSLLQQEGWIISQLSDQIEQISSEQQETDEIATDENVSESENVLLDELQINTLDTSQEVDFQSDDSAASPEILPNEITPNPVQLPASEGPIAQSYTNEFFPGFSINYDSSWKFDTQTQASGFSGLLKRTITLTKGGTTLTFNFGPSTYYGGCGRFDRGPESPFVSFNNQKGTFLSRYNAYEDGDFYSAGNYDAYYDCPYYGTFQIPTVITSQAYADAFGNGSTNVPYDMKVRVKGAEFVFEADEIIKNSVF